MKFILKIQSWLFDPQKMGKRLLGLLAIFWLLMGLARL